MTPKEKAEDLFVTFYQRLPDSVYSDDGAKHEAKQFSLIAVDELIKEELLWLQEVGGNESESEWIKVKQEINNL
jgi:hypothetical protein